MIICHGHSFQWCYNNWIDWSFKLNMDHILKSWLRTCPDGSNLGNQECSFRLQNLLIPCCSIHLTKVSLGLIQTLSSLWRMEKVPKRDILSLWEGCFTNFELPIGLWTQAPGNLLFIYVLAKSEGIVNASCHLANLHAKSLYLHNTRQQWIAFSSSFFRTGVLCQGKEVPCDPRDGAWLLN